MEPDRWKRASAYINDIFGAQDDHLAGLMTRAIAAGLPDIAVSADVGHQLSILTSLVSSDRRATGRALELGTLGGYSGIWIARALPPTGRLITVEFENRHADFAQREFETAGVAERVEIVRGAALDVLASLAARLGPDSLDLAFIDAVKAEYPAYFQALRPLVRPGGLLIADNALGTGGFDVPLDPEASAGTRGVHRLNQLVAGDPDFEAACIPLRQGVLVARRRDA
jgi:predicted O-methyltransferase YrrM